MSSPPDIFIKMEMINDDLINEEIHPFHIEHFSSLDEREDACTQTDGHSACKHDLSKCSYTVEVPEIGSEESAEADMSFYECHFFNPPTARRRISHCHKDKTPKIMKLLKEKHRENERLRHHSLNQHLRLICKNVPGSAEEGKETKVVMMQRIISYIAFLENTVKYMCSQLSLEVDPSWIMLTSSVKDIEKSGAWRNDFLGMSSDDSRDSGTSTSAINRRLKLSSPTIDSTTDPVGRSTSKSWSPHLLDDSVFQGSQESATIPSSLYFDVKIGVTNDSEEWIVPSQDTVTNVPGNFNTLLITTDSEADLFELPSSTFETKLKKTPDEVKWLGSPDRSPSYQQGKSENSFGIRCDPKCLDEQPFDVMPTFSVSPDTVVPKTAIRLEPIQKSKMLVTPAISHRNVKDTDTMNSFAHDTKSCYHMVRSEESHQISGANIHKQISPMRTPLLNVTNYTEALYDIHERQQNGEDTLKHITSDYHDVKNICTLIKAESASNEIKKDIRDVTYEKINQEELVAEHAKVPYDAHRGRSARLDLRKSSWMNGFMMYSRIHRKRFIRENPGLQTSSISRLMGQRWRGMSSAQRQPYRDQAHICSQGLLQTLEKDYRS